MIDGDARVEWLAQREDLRSLPQRYARAIDARDIDAVAALFDPEGTVDGARGPASVPDYVEMLRQSGPAFQTTMHVLGDPLISHEPGSATAHLDTYAVVHQLDKVDGSGGDATLGVRYLDDVVQRGGRWVIRHRQARILWHRASAG